jgi:hypothetical protein
LINLFQFNRKRVIVQSFDRRLGRGSVIALVVATSIILAALQASINAPTAAFRSCLKEATGKATSEKVAGDAYEAYARNACSVPMSSLKSAVVGFRMKNGMGRKAAADDADMTVDDYLATSVDNYQFMANMNAPQKPATASTQAAAPATSSPQQPKPQGQ